MKEVVIFLGPSLSLVEAQNVLQAHYLPPAKKGDLLSVAAQFRPRVIGLIDGFFSQELSTWHKEILYALSQGIVVLGASSMGALRAAETADFGMVGVGKIFERYKSGEIIDDDEVVLIHGPKEENYIPLSLPLINIRFTLELAKRENRFPSAICEAYLTLAKSLHYPNRTWERIGLEAKEKGLPNEVLEFLQNRYLDQKKEDALLLLQKIETFSGSAPQKIGCPGTPLFQILYHYDRHIYFPPMEIPLRSIAHYVALHHPCFNELRFHALNQALVDFLATLLKAEVTTEEIEEEKERFYLRHHLLKESDRISWLERNHLTQEEFQDLASRKARARKLQNSHVTSQAPWKEVKFLLEELKWTDQYEEWTGKALGQEVAFRKAAEGCDFLEESIFFPEDLSEEHARETSWSLDVDEQVWAKEAGFRSSLEMLEEMMKAKIARGITS